MNKKLKIVRNHENWSLLWAGASFIVKTLLNICDTCNLTDVLKTWNI